MHAVSRLAVGKVMRRLISLVLLLQNCAATGPARALAFGTHPGLGLQGTRQWRSNLKRKAEVRTAGGVQTLTATAEDGEGDGFKMRGTHQAGGNVGDLALLGAVRKLRVGDLKTTREVPFPGYTNENYKFVCEKSTFFVKLNRNLQAKEMFEGEAMSLKAMKFAGMSCPSPVTYGDLPDGGSYLIMQWLDFDPFAMIDKKAQKKLGQAIAVMHGHQPERHQFFGFGVSTRVRSLKDFASFGIVVTFQTLGVQAGALEMNNKFCASWSQFFVEQRLRPHLKAIIDRFPEKSVDLARLADDVCSKSHEVLEELGEIRPSALHGNLCMANAGAVQREDDIVTPFVFDPSSFYGHSEFDLAYSDWPVKGSFIGLSDSFLKGYHEILPRASGHEEREQIYQFLHILEHVCSQGETYIPLAYQHARKILN